MKRPCKYAGCAQLVDDLAGYCERHLFGAPTPNPQTDAITAADPRGSARWQKLRELYLSSQPLCESCEASGRVKPADEVHHTIPIANGGDCFDQANLQALCKSCHYEAHYHDDHTTCDADVRIVCGPPASGKTTWVKANMNPGDIVVDWDAIYSALSCQPAHIRPRELRPIVKVAFDCVLDWIDHAGNETVAWIIRTAPRSVERRRLKRRFNASRIIVMATPFEVCADRIKADADRLDKADWIDAAARWWREYEPFEGDDLICP